MLQGIAVLVAVFGTALAAWEDLRTSFIDDKVVYAMIAIGLLIGIVNQLILFNLNALFLLVGGVIVIGGVGYYLFKTGQFGMGDVLLLAGIHALLPAFPVELVSKIAPFTGIDVEFINGITPIPPVLSVLITACLLALVWNASYYTWQLAKARKLVLDVKIFAALAGMFTILIGVTEYAIGLTVTQLVFFLVVGLASALLAGLRTSINRHLLIKQITFDKLLDEDVIAIEEMNPTLVKRYNIDRVLTSENKVRVAKLMQTEHASTIPVFVGLPRFGPFILIALVLMLALVNPITITLLK